jgi:hypothetical protein
VTFETNLIDFLGNGSVYKNVCLHSVVVALLKLRMRIHRKFTLVAGIPD